MKRLRVALLVVLTVIFLDQSLKIWVKLNMYIGQSIDILSWFKIYFTENKGMAFGLTFGGEQGKLFLSLFRIFAVLGLTWYVVRLARLGASMGFIVGLSMIIGGAIGNILDSAFYGVLFSGSFHSVATFLPEGGGYAKWLHGSVVDMFYFPVYHGYLPNWLGGRYIELFRPIFNIADVAITLGVATLLTSRRTLHEINETTPPSISPQPTDAPNDEPLP